ncbi:MAG: hypothetical protein M1118_08725 [Chloroflexi bacterium]|nr:hypothetical protein [Chloroflexota bacterium]
MEPAEGIAEALDVSGLRPTSGIPIRPRQRQATGTVSWLGEKGLVEGIS